MVAILKFFNVATMVRVSGGAAQSQHRRHIGAVNASASVTLSA
jgi:hypothetical protein